VSYFQHHWPETKTLVRGDSHFAPKDFMDWTNKHINVEYITRLTSNAKLNELYQFSIESDKREYNQYLKAVKRYHSFMYKAESRENHQQVIVKVKVSIMGTNIRYIVTNLKEFRTRDLYEMDYCARVSIV
jgi:hypothetical protein